MSDAPLRMQSPRGRHDVHPTLAAGLSRLLLGGLIGCQVFCDRQQHVFGVVAKVCFGHVGSGGDQRSCEGTEFADDLLVMPSDELSQWHMRLESHLRFSSLL